MEFIEGLILGFFGGVVPPLLILIMTNDDKARAECLNSTYELGNEFERLSRLQRNTARTEKEDYDCSINIKNILPKISVKGAGPALGIIAKLARKKKRDTTINAIVTELSLKLKQVITN